MGWPCHREIEDQGDDYGHDNTETMTLKMKSICCAAPLLSMEGILVSSKWSGGAAEDINCHLGVTV